MKVGLLTKLYHSKPAQKYVDWALKSKKVVKNNVSQEVTNYSKLQKAVPVFFMAWLSLLQCYLFSRKKEMPKERRVPLILNEAYTCAMGVATSFLISKPVDKLTEKFVKRAEIVYKNNPKKGMLINGIKTAVPAGITVCLFQYVFPVIATPMATQTSAFLKKKGIVKFPESSDSQPQKILNKKA